MLYFKNLGLPKRSKDYAYKMGVDSAVNGTNGKNCSFSIFSSSENTKAWEDGKRYGEKQKQAQSNKSLQRSA